MNRTLLPSALLAFLLGACSTTATYQYVGSSDYDLPVPSQLEGEVLGITLQTSRFDGGSLAVRRSETRTVVEAGVTTREFDKGLRDQLESDLRPFAGLYVEAVAAGGAAAVAGIAKGDLILKAGGRELVEPEDLQDAIEVAGADGRLALAVRRGPVPSSSSEEEELILTPRSRTDERVRTERVPLTDPDPVDRPVLGVRMGGIPTPWNKMLFQDAADPVVITGVVPGSPAYRAGIRSGDIVFRVDGEPLNGMAAFQRRSMEAAAAGREMELEVRQGTGEPYRALVVPEDYEGRSRFYFPFLVDWDSTAQDTDWTFGPLGLLANYEGYYKASPDRQPRHDSSFSMLLGLFRVSHRGDVSRTRLLWLISWEN